MAERKDTGTSLAVGQGILLICLFGLIGIIWWNYSAQILEAYRDWRVVQMRAMAWVVPQDYVLGTLPNGSTVRFGDLKDQLENAPNSRLTLPVMEQVSYLMMAPLVPVFCGMIGLMTLWAFFKGPGSYFRRTYHGLDPLIAAQSRAFPVIAPLVGFDPSKQPVRPPGAPVPADLPPFAEALSPEEWIAYCGIPTLTERELDRDALVRAFARQLGGPWRGWAHMAPHRQVLLAAFCLKAARKRQDSDDLLGQLARCWTKGTLRISSALLRKSRGILRNAKLSGGTLTKCNQHAYENVALVRALATAREEGGVLASAQFVWLRAHDRVLWYPLNNLGRQAFHMEALGLMAHYKAEKIVGRPIVRPKVEGAVESIAEYMKSHRARPVPKLDYSRSRGRGIKKVKT